MPSDITNPAYKDDYEKEVEHEFLLDVIIALEEKTQKQSIWQRLRSKIVPRYYIMRNRRWSKFGSREHLKRNKKKVEKAIADAYKKLELE